MAACLLGGTRGVCGMHFWRGALFSSRVSCLRSTLYRRCLRYVASDAACAPPSLPCRLLCGVFCVMVVDFLLLSLTILYYPLVCCSSVLGVSPLPSGMLYVWRGHWAGQGFGGTGERFETDRTGEEGQGGMGK